MQKKVTIENNEEFLRQRSTEINFEKDNYGEWIESLKNFCQNNAVYALAPVQIGIPKRIIYFKNTSCDMTKNINTGYDEKIILINTVIIKAKGHTRFLERCASCLDYVAVINRPYLVEVEYYDITGKKMHETYEGFKATIFCHEYDHLDGILHIDLSDDVTQMTWEETKKYRDEHPYEIISKDKTFDLTRKKR